MELVTEISRIFIPIVTVIILTKCMMTLWLGHPKEKTYGYIVDMYDNERYELNMWETSIGRSNSCDISINYDTMPRFAAVISRRNDSWYVYDLKGVKVNGKYIKKKETITHGDVLSLGNMKFKFVVADDPVVKVGRKKRAKTQVKKTSVPKTSEISSQSAASRPINTTAQRAKPAYYKASQTAVPQYKSQPKNTAYTIETPTNARVRRTGKPVVFNKDTGEKFVLTGNEVTIGSGAKSGIKINSNSVAKRHASFVLYEDGWAIEAFNSQYITKLNGKKVTSPQLLFDGDVIAVGDERLYFKI